MIGDGDDDDDGGGGGDDDGDDDCSLGERNERSLKKDKRARLRITPFR